MRFEIKNKFLVVYTNPKYGETDKLKLCGAVLFERHENGLSKFLCPLQVDFIKKFIYVFGLNHAGLNHLLNRCIERDMFHQNIMDECDYYRDHPTALTPIDKLGSFAEGMYHAQKVSLYASLMIPRFGLFLSRGIGKTKVAIDNITLRLIHGQIKKILVLCPRLNITNTWLPEVGRHSKIKNLPLRAITGSKNDKIKMLTDEDGEFYIHVMTYDAARNYSDILKSYDILILDESKAIAGNSQRSEAVFKLSINAKYVILATGTVNTLKSMSDVFYQYKIMDLGATFGLKYPSFLEDYFEDKGKYYPKWVLRKGSMDIIRRKMFYIAISYKKSECMDLPERTIQDIQVEATPFQKEFIMAFSEGLSIKDPNLVLKSFFEKSGVSYIEEAQAINNSIPISRVTKLQEVNSGFYIPYTNNAKILTFPSEKLSALIETIQSLGDEKVIVWCRFTEDLERISRELKEHKIKSCLVSGKKDEVKKWQKSNTIQVLVGMESVGRGLTLNEAAYMIYYSYEYSLDNWNQSIDRNYRRGQNRNTTVFILKVKGSVDQDILASLMRNERISNKLTLYQFKKMAKGLRFS